MRKKLQERFNICLGKGFWKSLPKKVKMQMIELGAHEVWKLIRSRKLKKILEIK